MARPYRNFLGDWRTALPLLVRDNASPLMAGVARSLGSLGLHASGFGTGQLSVRRSGEHHVVELLLRRRASPTILDVGAFEGDYAVMARELLGPAAAIHCFEPGETGLPKLRTRMDEFAFNVHAVALSGAPGQVVLHKDPALPTMASLHPRSLAAWGRSASHEQVIEATTLDDFCAANAIGYVDLLKLDTEGTEFDVLRGSVRSLAEARIGIIQFEFGYGDVATRTFMRDFYDVLGATHAIYRVVPRGIIPLGEYHTRHEVFIGATNYVALPRDLDNEL